MLTILFTGLLAAAMPQTSDTPTTSAPPPALSTLVPVAYDSDAVCAVTMTEINVRFDQMPADKKAKYADFNSQAEKTANFYLGAATARRTTSDLALVADKATDWVLAQPNDLKANIILACMNEMPVRMRNFAAGLKSK